MAASSNSGGDDDGMVSGINVTPFVDICLVLLIVFMLTARFIDQKGITMNLPKAAQGQDVQLVFAVELHSNGTMTINGKPVTSDETLRAQAKEAQANNKDLRATIKADADVAHGRFVHAVDILKNAGVDKIAIGVTQSEIAPAATAKPAGTAEP